MKLRFLLRCGGAFLMALGMCVAGAQQQSNQAPLKAGEPKKKRGVADLSGFELEDASKARAENAKLGATRGGSEPKLLAPQRAKFYGANALFAWSYGGKANQFAVVFADQGNNEVFRGEVNGKEYHLPQKAYPFEPGKLYSWSVDIQPPMIGVNPSHPSEFVVVFDAERRQIEKALAGIPKGDEYRGGLARARIFTGHRLWFDAIGAYTDLIAKFPNHAELYEARGTIYSQLEITKPLADADFARADQLQTGTSRKN
jgi:hypothetical protein